MQLKSLRLYILFLVALGYQTEGCVLYKAESRAEENPLPGHFCITLYHPEELKYLNKSPGSVESEHVHEVEKIAVIICHASSRLATATQLDISPSRASLTPLFVCILLTLCFVGAS